VGAVVYRLRVSAFHTGKAFSVDEDEWIYGAPFEFRFAF